SWATFLLARSPRPSSEARRGATSCDSDERVDAGRRRPSAYSHGHANGSTMGGMSERDTCELLCLDLPKAEELRRGLASSEELETAAAGFKALTDATRVGLLLSLADGGSCCVCDLAWIVGRDEKLVSHHVRQLKQLGAVRSRRDGRMVMYELTELGAALVAS